MIYILEDDEAIRELVVYTLNNSGQTARGFGAPEDFYTALDEQLPSLVLLDLMLPGEDGITVLKKLRENPASADIPVIIVTAKSSEYDRVKGLDSGADDYLVKPFGMMELLARVRAQLRRFGGKKQADYTNGALYINRQKHVVSVGGKAVELTLKEFNLLSLLAEKPGMVFTRDMILSTVWGYEYSGESRTVDVHVRTLRTKLGECGGLIETVRGVGYRLREGTD